MPAQEQQIWDLWIPDVGATGISFARGRLDATNVIIVHAAPEKLNVEVRDHQGNVLAQGENLPRTTNSPMARCVPFVAIETQIPIKERKQNESRNPGNRQRRGCDGQTRRRQHRSHVRSAPVTAAQAELSPLR